MQPDFLHDHLHPVRGDMLLALYNSLHSPSEYIQKMSFKVCFCKVVIFIGFVLVWHQVLHDIRFHYLIQLNFIMHWGSGNVQFTFNGLTEFPESSTCSVRLCNSHVI